MTTNLSKYASFIKTISPVLSNTVFKKIIKDEELEIIKRRALKYQSYNDTKLNTYQDFFEDLYHSMLKNYRNEFVYKNEITNKILLGKHNLNTATVLNEFRIGKSIADLVILNGTSIVYEIKTEYDSPERLLSQIQEYRKSFLHVVIVTHYSVASKYESFLIKHDLNNIGLLVFSNRNTLTVRIKPTKDSNFLDINYMFKCLRKQEYSHLIKKYYGYVPKVPNTRLFKECLNLSHSISKIEFHELMFSYLKKRTIKEKKIVSSQKTPTFLKHISICSDFNKEDFDKIYSFLNKKL